MPAVFEDLGYSPCTAKAMVEDQGINTLDDLCFLKDGDVETLCKNVKYPGSAAWGNNRGANLGHLISQEAEMNTKLAAYYLRYSEKDILSLPSTDLTVQAICTVRDLHNSDGNWDDPKAPMINERDWPKTFDGIDESFRKCYGLTSIPLAYIIRKDSTPKEGEETDWDNPLE